MFTRSVLYFAGLAAVFALAAGCDNGRDGKVDAKIADAPVKSVALVEAERPVRRDISEYVAETSRITAESQVEVLAKGSGHCTSINVEEGDRVKEGQVLAELDRAEMEAQVRQSRVNAAQQKAAYERADRGFKEGIVSKAERDNAKFAYEQAEASLEMQEVQLSFLTIRSPIRGVVTERMIQEGMLVSTGTPVFTVVDPSTYVLPISVDERKLPRLRVGQTAYVTIDSVGDRQFEATVRRINPGVELQSHAVKVILEFDPEDHQYLREAAFARYQLVMDTHEDAVAVPKDAIIEDNTRRYVMVVEKAESSEAPDGGADADAAEEAGETAAAPTETTWVARRAEVETGLEDAAYTEILSGVSPEDLVITLGQQTVNDGDPVEVTTLDAALESKAGLDADEALEAAREGDGDEQRPRRRGRHGM